MFDTSKPTATFPEPIRHNLDGIPVLAQPPAGEIRGIWLHVPAYELSKEDALPVLQRAARLGYLGVSFDPWMMGARTIPEDTDDDTRRARIFANFRRNFWPILGQTAIEVPRVLDWAEAEFGIHAPITMTGHSMGGDIGVVAIGMDKRITRLAAVVGTPDWTRPAARDLETQTTFMDLGQADWHARFFHDALDPMTHPERYAHGPRIAFILGGDDEHVPRNGAERFRTDLVERYGLESVTITYLDGKTHMDFMDYDLWWDEAVAQLQAQ
ncbi:alpha/beta hydrolase family protein [Thioclava kandeliae]|uniref:Peptidase S9 prolyl oligopeptidase catalytic domain-containing protein n=1 Tax=Thioclava kandeliae TaxID=3070818 RepID=A0ABV1SCB1_9RHOB